MPQIKGPAPARGFVPRERTPSTLIFQLRTLLVAMALSPKWASSPAVQAAAAALAAAVDALAENASDIGGKETELATLRVSTPHLVDAAWFATDQAVASMNGVVDGTPADVVAFGMKHKTGGGKAVASLAADPPQNLRAKPGASAGTGKFRWDRARNAHGYLVQQSTAPGDPASWVQTSVTRVSWEVTGTPGQVVTVRVAVVRASGTSAFSAPVSLTVR